jgi:8-oxo-dGTP pyrophosphatase MutT (NUDIX family)
MDKYCGHCGAKHTSFAYPKPCPACERITYANPKPVAVLVQPVRDDATGRIGVLVGERGIEPQMGTYGLPGGYVDDMDASFEAGAIRELFEETGLKQDVSTLMASHTFSDGRNGLVFFFNTEVMPLKRVKKYFKPCDECPAIKVIWEPETLSFQSHTKAVERWFDTQEAIKCVRNDFAEGVPADEVFVFVSESVRAFVSTCADIREGERNNV